MVDSMSAARLWLPPMGLASCLRGVVMRNTNGLGLGDHQRLNYFPASPTCALTWFFEGSAQEIEPSVQGIDQGRAKPLAHRLVFSGPYTRPVVGRYTNPVHLMMMIMLPDAATALLGINPGDYVNKIVAANDVLDGDWLALAQRVFDTPDDTTRVALIEQQLARWWAAQRPIAPMGGHLLEDWHQGLMVRAATSGMGRSARQIERRIKQWTGQPLRELRGFGRSERAFFNTAMAIENGEVDWSDLAHEAGYADQSHLCRQTRRLTGFSPQALRHRITHDEGFWAYRIWGFSSMMGRHRTATGPREAP